MARRRSEDTLYEMLKPIYYGSRNEGGRWPRGHWTLQDADEACVSWLSDHPRALELARADIVRRTVRDIDRHEQANIADLGKMCLPGFEKELERLLQKPIATAVGERVELGECDPYEEWDTFFQKKEDAWLKDDGKREQDRRVNAHIRSRRSRGVRFQTMRDLLLQHPVPSTLAA